jgi:hypothetical protein
MRQRFGRVVHILGRVRIATVPPVVRDVFARQFDLERRDGEVVRDLDLDGDREAND